MKVLHIVDSFSALSETFIYDYITELERQGVDNHVLTFNRVNEEDRPFSKVYVAKIRRDFIWFVLRVIAHFNNKPNKWWAMQRREIKKIVKQVKPDIIHAQFGPMGVICSKITEKLKIPLLVTFHGYDISTLIRDEYWVKIYNQLFIDGSKFIGVSNHICEKLINIGCPKDKLIRFAAGIKIENFEYRETIIDKNNEIRLIHVGRLVEKKSPILLIKAFKIVYDYFRNTIKLKLIIIGEGPLKEQAIKLANDLSLKDNIDFLGAIKHKDLKNYLSQSHIYTQHCITASNGDQEGLGVTFLEASAIGLPIVTTRHNGIPDAVLNEKTGFLVDEGDYEDMALKIIKLIENPELAKMMGKAGREYVSNYYNIRVQVKIAINIYNEIVQL